MKLGLYSITYLGAWYRGEALTLPELIKTARRFGYDGVEIDGKRPHGNPLDWPAPRCKELRSMADCGLKVDRFRELDRVWHSGRWEGYRSTFVRFPKQELAIAILSNLGSFDAEAMAAKVAEVLLARELTEVSEENLPVKRVKIEEALQNDFLGRYETFSPHFTVNISKGTNDLMMEVSGPPAFPIVPESTNQFATMDGRARMRFERGVNGKVARLTVLQGKDVFAHWKVATDRQAVSGCEGGFFSDEIDARYSIVVRDRRLIVKRGREEAELLPLENEPGSFVGSEWWAEQIHFQQHNAGSIEGFALTTGRLKNLEFRKE